MADIILNQAIRIGTVCISRRCNTLLIQTMKDSNIIFRVSSTKKEEWIKLAETENLSLSAYIISIMNQYVRGLK